jgi:predicted metalloprotease with PDZ domain
MSGELWLAEGFTNYYGPLSLQRAGLTELGEFGQTLGYAVDAVTFSPGRQIRTAEEMSQMAPFVDAAAAIDRTDFDNTFISYYTWGEAIALGLDLTLRERSGGKVTLDDFMRGMWQRFGKPGGRLPGYVDRPYTIGDAKTVLASVSGDSALRTISSRATSRGTRLLITRGCSPSRVSSFDRVHRSRALPVSCGFRTRLWVCASVVPCCRALPRTKPGWIETT